MVHFTFHKQQHTTSCDVTDVTILRVCCYVTAVLGISKINCITDFFAINFLIAIIVINVFRVNRRINCD